MAKKEMLDHALEYAAVGWPVFALQPKGKKPVAGSRGFKDAATSEILITRSWDDRPDANIGMATGKVPELWVLDIDGEEGSQSLTAMETELGPLPETLEQRTGSGGRHLFFRWPAGNREVRNKQALRPGIDVRGEGGYVVLPPSVHPNGKKYEWPYGQTQAIARIPAAWLDVIVPSKKAVAPWDRPEEIPQAVRVPIIGSTPILERAKAYLAECEAATQGSGGHNALLWAARAMVIGFQLDDDTANMLLWSEFNPRCSPPWDEATERKEFERKVTQARTTPSEKPAGWLLDEYGLRSGKEAMANIIAGNKHAVALLAKHARSKSGEYVPDIEDDIDDSDRRWTSFPTQYFPTRLAEYCRQVAECNCVYPSYVAMPMLVVAGAAMGNAFRLKLKKDYVVPPVLWAMVVGATGANKSSPLSKVEAPLEVMITPENAGPPLNNPQNPDSVVDNLTIEALIQLLGDNHRGILAFCDELASWVSSFGRYKSGKGGGGDKQAWISMWNAGRYKMHRKTDRERIVIPTAACAVMGGIQPKVLAACFDPEAFDSGLVPRILVTCPPPRHKQWTEAIVGDAEDAAWHDTIMWLRTRPFMGLSSNNAQYVPHVLKFAPDAKDIFVSFYNDMDEVVHGSVNEDAEAFATKAQSNAARLCLIHHGLVMAESKSKNLDRPIGKDSAVAGTQWMLWFLQQQMEIYGFAAQQNTHDRVEAMIELIKTRAEGGKLSVREWMRANGRKYANVKDAATALQPLISFGLARWSIPNKEIELI